MLNGVDDWIFEEGKKKKESPSIIVMNVLEMVDERSFFFLFLSLLFSLSLPLGIRPGGSSPAPFFDHVIIHIPAKGPLITMRTLATTTTTMMTPTRRRRRRRRRMRMSRGM